MSVHLSPHPDDVQLNAGRYTGMAIWKARAVLLAFVLLLVLVYALTR